MRRRILNVRRQFVDRRRPLITLGRELIILRRCLVHFILLFSSIAPFSASAQDPEADGPAGRPNIVFILTDDQAPWALGSGTVRPTAAMDGSGFEGPVNAGPNDVAPEDADDEVETDADDDEAAGADNDGPGPALSNDGGVPWAPPAGTGHPDLRTPSMARLASEGALFTNAFVVTPVCSPSRAELLTGRYGSELNVTDWIHPEREVGHGLDPGLLTWVDLLNQEGYATGLIGKWHVGTQDEYHPTGMGYDHFFGFRSGGNTPRDPVLEKNGDLRRYEGFTQDILTDAAIDFLRVHRDEPFVLSVHYRAPHAPWLPLPEEDWAAYESLDAALPDPDYPQLDVDRLSRVMREYLAAVASVDRNLGRILDVLDELALTEHTIVIFTSDHGYNMGHNGIWHKGNGHWILTDPPQGTYNVPEGQRPNMYDNSLKVPLIVRWPGAAEPGRVVDEVVSNLDWYRTLVDMAGAEVPRGQTVRGRSIVPLLEGESPSGWPTELYAEYSTHHQSWTHMRAYRTPEWKLVRDLLNPDRDELYRLPDDPAETTNLIESDAPEVTRALEYLDARLIEHMREIGDRVLPLAERLEAP